MCEIDLKIDYKNSEQKNKKQNRESVNSKDKIRKKA